MKRKEILFVGHQVGRLDLERLDEAFRLGVVIGITPPAHRANQPVSGKQRSIPVQLKELLAEMMIENRLLKKSVLGDGEVGT